MVEKIIQQPQAQLEQAQIAAMLPMNDGQPIVVRDGAQANDPQIGQTSGEHQPLDSFGIAQVTLIQLKPPAFLVRKEGFDSPPCPILGLIRTTTGVYGNHHSPAIEQLQHHIEGSLLFASAGVTPIAR